MEAQAELAGQADTITADEAAAASSDLSSLAAAAVQEEPMAVDEAAAAAAAAAMAADAAASTPPLSFQSIRVLNPDGTLSEAPPGLLAGLGGVTQQEEAAAVLQQPEQPQHQEQLPQQQYRVINAMTGEEVRARRSEISRVTTRNCSDSEGRPAAVQGDRRWRRGTTTVPSTSATTSTTATASPDHENGRIFGGNFANATNAATANPGPQR